MHQDCISYLKIHLKRFADKTATERQIGKDLEKKTSPTVIEKIMKDFVPNAQHQPVLQESNRKAINDLTKRFESLEKSIQTLAKFIQ